VNAISNVLNSRILSRVTDIFATPSKPTCLQTFGQAFLNPGQTANGEAVKDFASGIAALTQTTGASIRWVGEGKYNSALNYGVTRYAAAFAAGRALPPAAASAYMRMLNSANKLRRLGQSLAGEEVVGEAGMIAVDGLLGNALIEEYGAIRNGQCIAEKDAISAILGY
jgi:hypothetical protein